MSFTLLIINNWFEAVLEQLEILRQWASIPILPLEMDDNRIDDGNGGLGAQCHLLDFRHRDHLPKVETNMGKMNTDLMGSTCVQLDIH